MENLPLYISGLFLATLVLALIIFSRASAHSKKFWLITMLWIALQTVLALSGFYLTNGALPKLPLLVLPPLVTIAILFMTKNGRQWIDSLDIKFLTLLHVIRIPVELVLFNLYLYNAVPILITYEGRNFDIFSGLSAGFVFYFGFVKRSLPTPIIVLWNFICLLLLLNVVFYALLSAPTSLQQFAFDQPNIAILHFPFVLLPGFLVPVVLFSHLASVRKLLSKKN